LPEQDGTDGHHDQRTPLKLEKRRRGRKPVNPKFRER
jgi:hypothetical protein